MSNPQQSQHTPTPATDAKARMCNVLGSYVEAYAEMRDFARNLERTIAELTEALDMAEAMAINLRSELLRGKVISGPVVAENLWLHAQKIRAALARAKEASK